MKASAKILPVLVQGVLLLAMHPRGDKHEPTSTLASATVPEPPTTSSPIPEASLLKNPGPSPRIILRPDFINRPPPPRHNDMRPLPSDNMRHSDGIRLPDIMRPSPKVNDLDQDERGPKPENKPNPPQNAFNQWAAMMGGFPPQPGVFPGSFLGMSPAPGGIPPQVMMMLPYLNQMMEVGGWGDKMMGWGYGGWNWNDMWSQNDDDNDNEEEEDGNEDDYDDEDDNYEDDYWPQDGWRVGPGGFPVPFPTGYPWIAGGFPGMVGGFPRSWTSFGNGISGDFGNDFGLGMGGFGLEDILEGSRRDFDRRGRWGRRWGRRWSRDDDSDGNGIRWFKIMMIKKSLKKMLFKAAYMGAMFSKIKLPKPLPGMALQEMPFLGMPFSGMPFPGMPFPQWPLLPPTKHDGPGPIPKPTMIPEICKVSAGNQTISRPCKYPIKVCAKIMQPKCQRFEISVCLPPKCAGLPPIEMKMCMLRIKKELMVAGNYKNLEEMKKALEEKMPPQEPDIEIDPFKKCLSEEDFTFIDN